jgi:solute carrier family 25 (mitochondrial carnitine/acylcarnitine transporter), member 20/29
MHFRPGHPFDLTKTRLQTAAPGAYTGAIDVVKKTVARDGVKGSVALTVFREC